MSTRRARPRVIELTQRRTTRAAFVLVTSEFLYLTHPDGDLVKLRRRTYQEAWRQPSEGFGLDLECRSGVVLGRLDTDAKTALRFVESEGRVAWEVARYYAAGILDSGALIARCGLENAALARIDLADGSILREWTLPEGFSWVHYLPGPQILGYEGDQVICYDPKLGEITWRRNHGTELVGGQRQDRVGEVLSISGPSAALIQVSVGAAPIKVHPFDEKTVLLESIALARCSIADGSLLWRFPLKAIPGRPYRVDGRVLVFQGRALVVLDENTGEEVFRREYDPERDLRLALRETVGVSYRNRLAIPFEEGYLAIIDTDDGRIVSMHRERQSLWRAVEIDGDLLLCTGDGKALIYGHEIWQV